jgi:hypothetical protein
MPKFMTRGEAESKRQKAVSFLRRLGKEDDAERFESMDAASYAEHRGAELLQNPLRRRIIMSQTAGPTKAELADTLDEVAELLESALDPALSREEAIRVVQEALDVAEGEEEGEEEQEEEEEE